MSAIESGAEIMQLARAVDSLPMPAWIANPDGALVHVSPGWERFTGLNAGDSTTGFLERVHPDDVAAVLEKWSAARASGGSYRDELRLRFGNGGYRWILAQANPIADGAGGMLGWLGTLTDVHDHRLAEQALAERNALLQNEQERQRLIGESRDKFVALAEQSNDVVAITDAAGMLVYGNPAALELLGTTGEELTQRHFFECFPVADVDFVESTIVPALERDGRWTGEFRFRNFSTGRALPIICNAFVLRDSSGAKTGYATISRDLRERQRVDIGMQALADAGKAMHGSLDIPGTVQNVADTIVSGFANVCSVEVPDESGAVSTYTLATRNPADAGLARKTAEVRNRALTPDHPIVRGIETGVSTLLAEVPQTFLASTGLDEFVGAGPGRLDIRSLIYVPVRSARDGRIYGVLSCGIDGNDPRGRYTEQDVRFAEQIAVRAGLAFDNAFAYERTRHIASELQAASLPSSLPSVGGLRLGADYRPASNDAAIGGDWYDAFALPDGRVVMTIGDVVGHGLQAAIWMTKMRQAMQSAALLSPKAEVLVGVANRALRMLARDAFATAIAAIYHPASRTLSVASAGHPGPVVRRRDGTVEQFDFPGLMLGLLPESEYEAHAIQLDEGDTAVFYTDGLVEVDRDAERGHERLHRALRFRDVVDAENVAFAVVERVLQGASSRDDIAVLAATVTPA